jgi:hypothetical protein
VLLNIEKLSIIQMRFVFFRITMTESRICIIYKKFFFDQSYYNEYFLVFEKQTCWTITEFMVFGWKKGKKHYLFWSYFSIHSINFVILLSSLKGTVFLGNIRTLCHSLKYIISMFQLPKLLTCTVLCSLPADFFLLAAHLMLNSNLGGLKRIKRVFCLFGWWDFFSK